MNKRRTASEICELVFEACGRILRRDSLGDLTLEKVAADAGLSKGATLPFAQ